MPSPPSSSEMEHDAYDEEVIYNCPDELIPDRASDIICTFRSNDGKQRQIPYSQILDIKTKENNKDFEELLKEKQELQKKLEQVSGISAANSSQASNGIKRTFSPDLDSFKIPPSHKVARNIQTKIPSKTVTSNKFSNLDSNVELNDKSQPPPPKTYGPFKNNIKPITIYTKADQIPFLKSLGEVQGIKFKAKASGEFTKIFPDSQDSYKAIIEYLDNKQVQHYLLPHQTARPVKAVIRGLPINMDIQEIENELKSKEFDIIKISQMIRFRTKTNLPLFLIHLPNTQKSKEIFQMTELFYMVIKVENYRSPMRTMQCHNCQFFHHTSEFCKMSPRCVKCNLKHSTNECSLGKEKSDNPTCCNCGGKHPANYRGCPKFPQTRKTFNSNFVQKNKSFADITHQESAASTFTPPILNSFPPISQEQSASSENQTMNNNPTKQNPTSIKEILDAIAQQLNCPSFRDLENHLINILEGMKNKNSQFDKLFVLYDGMAQLLAAP